VLRNSTANFTLVLLPGMDGTGTLFQPFQEAMGEVVLSLVVSYPGDTWLSHKQLVSLVLGALPTERPYVLLAESFSGPVAISVASQKPSGLCGLVLCAPFVKSPYPSCLNILAKLPLFRVSIPHPVLRWFFTDTECSASLVQMVSKSIQSVRPEVLQKRLQDLLSVDVTDSLSRCELPVVYIFGTRDRLLNNRGQRQVAAANANIQIVSIEEGPHLLLQCRPHEVARAVQPFLKEWISDNSKTRS
jgi:pimeloyl-ACP methyl ester carboxylesterase